MTMGDVQQRRVLVLAHLVRGGAPSCIGIPHLFLQGGNTAVRRPRARYREFHLGGISDRVMHAVDRRSSF